jgi:hypothetical protein
MSQSTRSTIAATTASDSRVAASHRGIRLEVLIVSTPIGVRVLGNDLSAITLAGRIAEAFRT